MTELFTVFLVVLVATKANTPFNSHTSIICRLDGGGFCDERLPSLHPEDLLRISINALNVDLSKSPATENYHYNRTSLL